VSEDFVNPTTYQITVKLFSGKVLTYHRVRSYTSKDGLITFQDAKTGLTKSFPSANVEIEEEARGYTS